MVEEGPVLGKSDEPADKSEGNSLGMKLNDGRGVRLGLPLGTLLIGGRGDRVGDDG